jgi:putative radical SAM enzyme (TIGR03279 family)
MPLKIIGVRSQSPAGRAGIKTGDTILSINSMPVNDFFDLQYYSNDYRLDFKILDPAGKQRGLTVLRQAGKPLGIEPESYKLHHCQNNCIFCFIDQMPPGMRKSLYLKDDDYLYSYVFGNYITLNNLTQADFDRITAQHISPLYISVHTTDSALRRKMMRHKGDFDILASLRHLAENGISYHLQIVCVPGYNCGKQLEKTLTDLLDSSLSTLSIGIVPVGLTKFRNELTPLEPFNPALAAGTLSSVDEFRKTSDIVYAADELYVKAGIPLPDIGYYNDFPQLENGIGMLRLTLRNFQQKRKGLIRELDMAATSFLMLTSELASGTLKSIAEDLNKDLIRSQFRVQTIKNGFFGDQVSVSGLLTATDILGQYDARPDETMVLPGNVFNHEGLTLDDHSQSRLQKELNRPLLVVDQYFEDWEWI